MRRGVDTEGDADIGVAAIAVEEAVRVGRSVLVSPDDLACVIDASAKVPPLTPPAADGWSRLVA